MTARQPDLFSYDAARAEVARSPGIAPQHRLTPETLSDAVLVEAIAEASLADAPGLAAEAARRRLATAVPALEHLCRRFIGFGADNPIPEQIAAVTALADIGGTAAGQALVRLLTTRAVRGPGLVAAVAAARRLGANLPAEVALALLRHDDPRIRADACGCVRAGPTVIAVLDALMEDSDGDVRCAAACALGRFGRPEARPRLMAMLRERPCLAAIEAVTAVADESCIILLGRIARTMPALAAAACDALEGIDHPRAAQILAAVRAAD